MNELMPLERVESRIFQIRGQKVMLDRDLAELYEVQTKRLNEAVKRNLARFPEEFMFQLSEQEKLELVANCDRFSGSERPRSQNATLKRGQNIKYLPYAFTEHGVAMLSSVLNSERAIQVNILIIKAFVRLRHVLSTHKELADKFQELEALVNAHDSVIVQIVGEINKIINPPQVQAIGYSLPKREPPQED
jgi:phage regulator Rha-like protein